MEQYQNIPDKGNTFPILKTFNLMKISAEPLAASLGTPKPVDPEQWYNKNPRLFQKEVANMQNHYPDALYGFLKSTGDMYWIVKLKIGDESISWLFFVGCSKDYPSHNSIYVTLLKSPSFSDLRERARENGRPGIPHTYNRKLSNGEFLTCLSISEPGDASKFEGKILSTVTALIGAADWALHFEIGLKNKEVWNKWCGY